MKEQFVTYEIAKKLKELGFDEPCFGYYVGLGDNKDDPFKLVEIKCEKGQFEHLADNVFPAPLWQQAIDWLFEKYKIAIMYCPQKEIMEIDILRAIKSIEK